MTSINRNPNNRSSTQCALHLLSMLLCISTLLVVSSSTLVSAYTSNKVVGLSTRITDRRRRKTSTATTRKNHPSSKLSSSPQPPEWVTQNNNNSASSSSIVTASDSKQQLFAAFTNLDLTDQYDAVLTGLCAKILDSTAVPTTNDADSTATEQASSSSSASTTDQIKVQLQDCSNLVNEMISAKITPSSRSLMAYIDSTVKVNDASTMRNVMQQISKNGGGCTQFGLQQVNGIRLFPMSDNQKILCPDGSMKTMSERFVSSPAFPVDDRVEEINAAVIFAAVAVACEFTNLFGIDFIQGPANFILTSMIFVVAIDNFYDIIKTTSQFAMSKIKSKTIQDIQLPEKRALPFGLGSGDLTGTVVRGVTRLVTNDPQREAICEGAALVSAYVLGLSCYAFRPNAFEGSVLVLDPNSDENLLSESGILRMLIWLLSPAAAEGQKYPQLIMSDPREAIGFLQRIEDDIGTDNSAVFWSSQREELLQWAYIEADALLRNNKGVIKEVTNRLSSGAATIGDCVAVIESW